MNSGFSLLHDQFTFLNIHAKQWSLFFFFSLSAHLLMNMKFIKFPFISINLTWVLLKSSIGEIETKKTYEILSLSNSLFSFLIWAFTDHHFYAIKAFSITLFFFFSDIKEQVSALTGHALTSTFKVLGVVNIVR